MEKEVYSGKILKITEEKINSVIWERVYLPSGVIIFPITHEGKIILINEKRPHENPPQRIRPVSGILEPDKGTPTENAVREMQEEIGLRPKEIELFWTSTHSGTVNTSQYYFIAQGLTPSKLPNPDGEDLILEVLEYSPQELFNALMNDQIRWSHSTLGILRLLARMGIFSKGGLSY